MNSFISYITENEINEDVSIIDSKVVFDADSGTGIKSNFGKGKTFKPFTKTIGSLMSYSLYYANVQNNTEILRAVKSADFSTPEAKNFLNRSAIYGSRIARMIDADVIVTPKSSSSLNKEFANKLQEKTGNPIYVDSFEKTLDVTKIGVDKDNPKITQKIIDSLEASIKRGIKRGYITVSLFMPQHRPFITGLFEVSDEKLMDNIQDKHVLIVDDVMTSGTTAQNITNILMANGAKKCSVLTLFKNK